MYESVEMAIRDGNLPMTKNMLEKGEGELAHNVRKNRTFNHAIRENDAKMLKLLIDFECVSFDYPLIALIDLHDGNTRAINALFDGAPELFVRCVANYRPARLSLRLLAKNHLSEGNPMVINESIDCVNPN